MKNILWVIQNNLIERENFFGLAAGCKEYPCPYLKFTMEPDETELPDIPNDLPVVWYGTTFMTKQVVKQGKWNPGVYFDLDSFRSETYAKNYGDLFVNSFFNKTDLDTVIKHGSGFGEKFFMRPDKDLKEFTGCVVTLDELKQWLEEGDVDVPLDTEVITSDVKDIKKEWRLVILDGQICAGSQYKENGVYHPSTDLPDEVLEFTKKVIERWTPIDVYCIDIALTDKGLFVMECNCFNCSGLYLCNKTKIIREVSDYVLGVA